MDKVIIDGLCPQTNYTTQQFYTKEEYDKLQAENEFLKKELEKHKSMIAHNLKPLFDSDFQGKLKELQQENERHKQALQEIRDLAEKEIVCDNCNFEGTDKCDAGMCTHFYLNDFSKDILDKINSVIGAE